jgi:uncharacterized membrane protein
MTDQSPSAASMQSASAGKEVRRPEVARPEYHGQSQGGERNVGTNERLVGGLAGAAMVLLGLKHGGLVSRLALLGLGGSLLYRSTTGYCSLYGVLGINTAQDQPATPEQYFARGVHVEKSYLVAKPAAELYAFWRDFANLPRFMKHLEKVEVLSPTRSRWTAKAPLGQTVSWEAEIIHDQPNELIAWKSMENSTVANAGSVRFLSEQGGETIVKVVLDYIPPGGTAGKLIAQLFGEEPSQQIQEDLRRFKSIMETGEAPTTQGQSQGSH